MGWEFQNATPTVFIRSEPNLGLTVIGEYTLINVLVICSTLNFNMEVNGKMLKCAIQPNSMDHLLIKPKRPHLTSPQGYTFHVIEPAYKDHLCIRTIFRWSLGWSLYTSFTVS